MELLKKENLLIVAALVCAGLWCYSQSIKDKELPWLDQTTKFLPIAGGLAFGLNTLIQIAK